MYREDELIPISALNHFLYCQRRCALIHIENIWNENIFTAEGRSQHTRVHGEHFESRSEKGTEFSLPVRSLRLGIAGVADIVETGADGTLTPVEYKHGKPKTDSEDSVQLCAQALCLEEMTGRRISTGYLFYFKIRKRVQVEFEAVIRRITEDTIAGTRNLLAGGVIPKPKYEKRCHSCSLFDACMPKIIEDDKEVTRYVGRMVSLALTDEVKHDSTEGGNETNS